MKPCFTIAVFLFVTPFAFATEMVRKPTSSDVEVSYRQTVFVPVASCPGTRAMLAKAKEIQDTGKLNGQIVSKIYLTDRVRCHSDTGTKGKYVVEFEVELKDFNLNGSELSFY